jgi:hypothetical protein
MPTLIRLRILDQERYRGFTVDARELAVGEM